jgi:hypothetical protein
VTPALWLVGAVVIGGAIGMGVLFLNDWHENYRWSRAWSRVTIDELMEKESSDESEQ